MAVVWILSSFLIDQLLHFLRVSRRGRRRSRRFSARGKRRGVIVSWRGWRRRRRSLGSLRVISSIAWLLVRLIFLLIVGIGVSILIVLLLSVVRRLVVISLTIVPEKSQKQR